MALQKAKTSTGVVSGVRGNNPSYTVFKGIPYAAPPVGDLRFRSPAPHEPWEGELLCNDFGPTPIIDMETHVGNYAKDFYMVQMPRSEDCLRLHIWTPADSEQDKLPVMVWYHGGGFSRGYSYEIEFDGEAFCKEGCILVSVSYRLGPLGFLCHPYLNKRSDTNRSGNYGALDQVFALKWVRENIRNFGGNPDNITIFGQSAGGGSVRNLLASRLSRGLFHRAIVQSAGGIGHPMPGGSMKEDELFGEKLVNALGWKPEELLTKSAEEIYFQLIEAAYREGIPMAFRPTVDGYYLDQASDEAIDKNEIADVPIMCGAVAGDGQLRYDEYEKDPDFDKIKKILPAIDTASWGYVYGEEYHRPVYTYYFDRKLPGDEFGASTYHSCELWYTFGTLQRCWRPFTGYDYELSSLMVKYWTNFARQGEPNGEGLPRWNAYTRQTPDTMNFGDGTVSVINLLEDPIAEKLIRENLENTGFLKKDSI